MIDGLREKLRSYEQIVISVVRLLTIVGFAASLAVVAFDYVKSLAPTALATLALVLLTVVIGVVALTRRVFLSPVALRDDAYSDAKASDTPDGIRYYEALAKSSRAIARGLYDRSGVYLVVGVSTALAGLGVFYLVRMNTPAGEENNIVTLATSFLPATSMLVLIELIAFFFLRQSRAVMDEFRHFESLARHREEVLAALRLAEDQSSPIMIADFVANGHFFSKNERLAAGETTEIIEGRKLEKGELEVLDKVVALIGARSKA